MPFLSTALADDLPIYHLGKVADPNLIKQWDIAIGPSGKELPSGTGRVSEGAEIYAAQCAYCHGVSGREGPDHVLVGGLGSLNSEKPLLTIGSYWSRATTLFDYIYRAMPFVAPGSLAPDEVYALCAFLLHLNGVIAEDTIMTESSLPLVEMPNRHGFVSDQRPETFPQH